MTSSTWQARYIDLNVLPTVIHTHTLKSQDYVDQIAAAKRARDIATIRLEARGMRPVILSVQRV